MKRLRLIILSIILAVCCAEAQNVTVSATDAPASTVFRSIMEQTDLNFVYSSDLLKDIRMSIKAENRPLRKVLDEIFRSTDITYTIKGKNVVLRRKARKAEKKTDSRPATNIQAGTKDTIQLKDVVVVSRLEAPAVHTSEIGARKITADNVIKVPAMFGESDVIKALQTLPGVSEGTAGLAGMYVHGGNADENLCMLDNVPLYQVNHFGGIFSAFNPEVIRYIDFYKSSFPARYDGRLSSFMDVRTRTGIPERRHGTVKLGLTAGSFNISAPIGKKTSYLLGIRRSWLDFVTIPLLAIANSKSENGDKADFRYYFMDLNAKVMHRFSDIMNGFVSIYFGDDYLKTLSKDVSEQWYEKDKYNLHWGNLLAQAGLNYRFRPDMTAEFTAAFTRYFSGMKHSLYNSQEYDGTTSIYNSLSQSDNSINDWIFRGDFDWHASENSHVRFGAGYTRHTFEPGSTRREYTVESTTMIATDSIWRYGADEFNAYIEDDLTITPSLRANIGIHGSLFHIDGKTHGGVSPRLSLSWHPRGNVAFKTAYSRTVQYVHQLTQLFVSMPSDQWIPVTGRFRPQTADKISAGAYWQSPDGHFTASAEAYWKWMRNIIEYRDEYYLRPPLGMWDERLTSGKGTAKGIDFNIEKTFGKLTGHVSYSLAWADRTFKDKNGGHTYPARTDNRHTIKIAAHWKASKRVELNAVWTGHSGNRYTLMTQRWQAPEINAPWYEIPLLKEPVNNYRLPFYHRLDLSCVVHNRRGYFTFSVYNAYCHMNTTAIVYDYDVEKGHDVFRKAKFLPIIPSISYTWQF